MSTQTNTDEGGHDKLNCKLQQGFQQMKVETFLDKSYKTSVAYIVQGRILMVVMKYNDIRVMKQSVVTQDS